MSKRRKPDPEVSINSVGFAIACADGTTLSVRWDMVEEIVAFKVDCVTFDTIVLAFRVSDDDRYVEVDEEWPGFAEVLGELEQRYNIQSDDWWPKVVHPAFATNRTTLWKRSQ